MAETTPEGRSLRPLNLVDPKQGPRAVEFRTAAERPTRRSTRSLVAITGDLEWLATAEPIDAQHDADSLLVEAVITLGIDAAACDQVDRLVFAYRRAKQ